MSWARMSTAGQRAMYKGAITDLLPLNRDAWLHNSFAISGRRFMRAPSSRSRITNGTSARDRHAPAASPAGPAPMMIADGAGGSERTARDWRFIETVARRGYRFSHGVRAEFPQSGSATEEGDGDSMSGAAVLAGRYVWRRAPRDRSAGEPDYAAVISAADRANRHPRIAVLPFRIIAGDDYFADGITESLIANLAQVGALRVISRTSVTRYRERRASLPEIAQELSADYVVEGSIFQTPDRVRITAQLSRAADDEQVWARQYDREMRDLLGLQNEVTVAISREVGVRLTSDERSRLSESPVLYRIGFDPAGCT